MQVTSFWDRIEIPLGIMTSLNNIFGSILIGGVSKVDPDKQEFRQKKQKEVQDSITAFKGYFPENVFTNSYAIFYEIITDFKLEDFTADQMESILETNRDLVLDSPYINKAKYSQTKDGNIASDDDILNAFIFQAIDDLNRLSNMDVTFPEYETSCKAYINWYQNKFAEFTAVNMASIMSDDGYDERQSGKRTKHYHGIEDMTAYYNKNMKIIKSMSENNRIQSTVIGQQWLDDELRDSESIDKDRTLFKIGIEEIDNVIGYLRRGHMLGIMGPPKGGKTRFTNYIACTALMHGFNVCVWPLEGTKEDWIAMLTSCLIAKESYGREKNSDKILRISSNDIEQNTYNTDDKEKDREIRNIVNSAKTQLAINPKFGKLSFIEGTAYVEDFLDQLKSHWETDNQFDILIIDPLINIMTKTGIGKVERISDAYKNLLNFINHGLRKPVLAIIPAQLKQDYVDFLRRNPDETIDVTAGGESAETERTPDDVIGLFSNKDERANNIMHIYSVASRHNGNFPDFQAKCYLECCMFMHDDSAPSH